MSDPLSALQRQDTTSASGAMQRQDLVAWLCAALQTPVAEIDEYHELAQEVTRRYHRDGTPSQLKVKSVNKLAAAKLLITLLGWNKPEPDPAEAESQAAWNAFIKRAAAEPQPWELEMQRRAERDAAEAHAAAQNPATPATTPASASESHQSYPSHRSSESYSSTPEAPPVLTHPPTPGPPPPGYSNEPAPYQECEPPSPWDKSGFNGQVRAVGGFRRPS